jgi:rubredoxin
LILTIAQKSNIVIDVFVFLIELIYMKCRMCGYEFDEKTGQNCQVCGKSNCSAVHCPNCGYGNSPEFEEEFKIITALKNKLGFK